jgi:hypothetical protein
MTIAMIWATLTGLWDANHHPLPYEEKQSKKPEGALFPILNEDSVTLFTALNVSSPFLVFTIYYFFLLLS